MLTRRSRVPPTLICPQCGGPRFPDEIEGLCLRCLRRMLSGLETMEPSLPRRSWFAALEWLVPESGEQ